jgi:hypothetical protein
MRKSQVGGPEAETREKDHPLHLVRDSDSVLCMRVHTSVRRTSALAANFGFAMVLGLRVDTTNLCNQAKSRIKRIHSMNTNAYR